MQDKVVLHYLDHTLIKGITSNFSPVKSFLHVQDHETQAISKVYLSDLKAVYFVKTYEGNPKHEEVPDSTRDELGRKVKLVFKDGEILYGYTQSFTRDLQFFNVFPADPQSNNERIFVNRKATETIKLVEDFSEAQHILRTPEQEFEIVRCPSCNVKNRVSKANMGKKVKCGKCRNYLF
ncbi:MAG: hypothetical protein JSV21_06730 [Nitrospirota bacterium]|nr:MAG: hypothetical protein JSV21_06730 [Nitrospirota bacterium]